MYLSKECREIVKLYQQLPTKCKRSSKERREMREVVKRLADIKNPRAVDCHSCHNL